LSRDTPDGFADAAAADAGANECSNAALRLTGTGAGRQRQVHKWFYQAEYDFSAALPFCALQPGRAWERYRASHACISKTYKTQD